MKILKQKKMKSQTFFCFNILDDVSSTDLNYFL